MRDRECTRQDPPPKLGALADLIGTVTKNRIGYGHPLAYYKCWADRQGAEAVANIISMLGHPYPAWGQLARVFVPHLTAAVKRNCSVSDNNPREQLNTDAEKLIQEYKQRFKDEPPYFLLQGQALLDAVKEALEKNRPIPFEVPDQGFA